MIFLKNCLLTALISFGGVCFCSAQTQIPYRNFIFDAADGINKNPALTSASELTAVIANQPDSSDKTDFNFMNHGNAPVYFSLSDNGKEICRSDYLIHGADAHLKISTNNYVGRKIKISCWTPCYAIGPKTNIWWPDNGDFFITIPPANRELQVALECSFNNPPLK
jgi:hypothetical protein